jgi:hypothetical protein
MSTATAPRPRPPARHAPRFESIPDELKARRQWVVWRYGPKQKNGKRKKIPYIAGVGDPASTTDPATWRSYAEAVAFYQSRSGYYAGIGYVFSADDPYVGGDIDHCLDAGLLSDFGRDHLPATYAEISPSGNGVKFIARATGTYGTKKPLGELYSWGRFFTLTGNALPGHAEITEQQAAVEQFYQAIGGSTSRTVQDSGSAGNGSRAQLAADIPESDWEAGRRLLRTQRENLLGRVRAAAGEETQFALLLRRDYDDFHQRWPFVGIKRADGTLDASQVRAVASQGIRGRGFTFPEYCAIMSALYAAEALAKWGTKEAWRQELAALWDSAPAPRYQRKTRPTSKPKARRGRAGNHADLVEQVYALLQDHRAGAQAVVRADVIAQAIGAHRRTVVTILNELRDAKRITTRRAGQYGGLIITFSDVIYSATPEAAQPTATPEIDPPSPAAEETTKNTCVSSMQIAPVDHISPAPTLHEAVKEAFDAYNDRPRIKRKKGRPRRAPLTRKKIVAYVEGCYPALDFTDEALDAAIEQERRDRRLADLATMKPATLRAEIRTAEDRIEASRRQGTAEWRWWKFFVSKARQELASRPATTGPGRKPCEVLPDLRETAAQLRGEWLDLADDAAVDLRAAQVGRAVKVEAADPGAAQESGP